MSGQDATILGMRHPPTRRRALQLGLFAALIAAVCGGLDAAAALVPAPAGVMLGVVTLSLAGAMSAGVMLPAAIASLRGAQEVDALRRHLDDLPETPHPLGL